MFFLESDVRGCLGVFLESRCSLSHDILFGQTERGGLVLGQDVLEWFGCRSWDNRLGDRVKGSKGYLVLGLNRLDMVFLLFVSLGRRSLEGRSIQCDFKVFWIKIRGPWGRSDFFLSSQVIVDAVGQSSNGINDVRKLLVVLNGAQGLDIGARRNNRVPDGKYYTEGRVVKGGGIKERAARSNRVTIILSEDIAKALSPNRNGGPL